MMVYSECICIINPFFFQLTKDGIIDHFSTISIVNRLSEEDRQKTLSDMRQILDTDSGTKERLPFIMYTDVCHYIKS